MCDWLLTAPRDASLMMSVNLRCHRALQPETDFAAVHRRRRLVLNVIVTYVFAFVAIVTDADQTSRQILPQAPPPSTGTELHYAVREELPVGSRIADIVADAGLHIHGIDAVRSFRFRLINLQQHPVSSTTAAAVNAVFTVGESTGLVRVAYRLDRESLCPITSSTSGPTVEQTNGRCIMRLDIAVQPMNYFQLIKVYVEIMDINDNSPSFYPDSRIIELSESTPLGTAILLPLAMDPDVGQNGVQRYELTGDADDATDDVTDDKADSGTSRSRHSSPRRLTTAGTTSPATSTPRRGRVRARQDKTAQFPFNLTTTRKSDGSTEVKLIVVGPLDRENRDRYNARVTAYDGDNGQGQSQVDGVRVTTSRSGSLDVTILIMDANDNGPVFERDKYVATLVENSAPGTRVAQLYATDADIGDNGRIVYLLQAGGGTASSTGGVSRSTNNDDNGVGTFTIDERTGLVSVSGVVDYETHPTGYRLMVTARDCGSPEARSTDAIVVVGVVDVNDNAPIVRINTIQISDARRASVPEDAPPETFVAHVIATDADTGDNGRVDCRLIVEYETRKLGNTEPQMYFQLHATNDAEYHLVTSGLPLDRELRSSYEVDLVCSDSGEPPLTTVRHLTVDITDVNDNPPRFDRPLYHVELLENNYVGAFIAQLNATDPDDGPNALIHYRLADDELNQSTFALFSVDPLSGMVTANSVFDRERLSRYRIKVLAIDAGGVEPLTGTATLVLDVIDVDDELPYFSTRTYGFSVTENQPIGTSVGWLSAVDADSPPFNRFHFRFRPSDGRRHAVESDDAFSIDQWSGVIATTRLLDREERDAYELIVEVVCDVPSNMASDEHGYRSEGLFSAVVPGFSSTATVVIKILDVNDNSPSFIFPEIPDDALDAVREDDEEGIEFDANEKEPDPRVIAALVSNRSVRGKTIAEVKAFDPDEGDNATVEYSIVTGNDRNMFTIDPQLGLIRLNVDLTGEREVHKLTVAATDWGTPARLSSSARLLLIVNETSTPSYPPVGSDRRTGGQQLQPLTVHGRRQTAPGSTSAGSPAGHGRATGRQIAHSSSTSTSVIILVGAACGSGFVLVVLLITVSAFVVHRRRLQQQQQQQLQQHQLVVIPMCLSCRSRCCHDEAPTDTDTATKCRTGSPTPATTTAVYTVDARSPIKQLGTSGRKVNSATSATATTTSPRGRLFGDDVNDDVWVNVRTLLPVVTDAQPDVLPPPSSPSKPENVSSGRVCSSAATLFMPEADRGPRDLEYRECNTSMPADTSMADACVLSDGGQMLRSNTECLGRADKLVPEETIIGKLHKCRRGDSSGSPMTSLSNESSASDTPTSFNALRQRQQATSGSKVNGNLTMTSHGRGITLERSLSIGNGSATIARLNKTVPPPPPPPSTTLQAKSAYCRQHYCILSSSGTAAPSNNSTGCRKCGHVTSRPVPVAVRSVMSGVTRDVVVAASSSSASSSPSGGATMKRIKAQTSVV